MDKENNKNNILNIYKYPKSIYIQDNLTHEYDIKMQNNNKNYNPNLTSNNPNCNEKIYKHTSIKEQNINKQINKEGLTEKKENKQHSDEIPGRIILTKKRIENNQKIYNDIMKLKILIWNIRSINTEITAKERKLNFLKNTIIQFQPEIVYIIDANKQTFVNPAYNQHFDDRNILLIRKEIITDVKIQENMVIDNKNKLGFIYLPPNKTSSDKIQSTINYIDQGYTIFGDLNLNTNKTLTNALIKKNAFISGEESAQTVMVTKNELRNNLITHIHRFAPSDHELIIFIIKAKIKTKSFQKVITVIEQNKKKNQVWNILQGKEFSYQSKLIYSRVNFKKSDLQSFTTIALNQFLHNNSHLAYVMLANKFNIGNFLGQLETYPNIVKEWQEYMGHDEKKNYKKITIPEITQISNTFNNNIVERINKQLQQEKEKKSGKKIDKPTMVKKVLRILLTNIKKFKSNAKNEEQISIKDTNRSITTFINHLFVANKDVQQAIEKTQNIIRNVAKLNNRMNQTYFKGETFFIKKKKQIIEKRKDTRLIYISPIIMTVFESLTYKELSKELNKAISNLTKSSYGGVDGGSTYAFLYNLTFSAQIYRAKALLITDITTGYDAINFNLLEQAIKQDQTFSERGKFLLIMWSKLAYNLDIWIGNNPVKKTKGIAMGFALSPLIFVYYVANALKEWKFNNQIFCYIDDITIMFKEKDDFKPIIQQFRDKLKKYDLNINLEKSYFLIELHGRKNNRTSTEINLLKLDKEFEKIQTKSAVTLLGREITLSQGEVVSYNDKFIEIVNNNIKAIPKWIPLMIKRLILDGSYTAKIRYITMMLATKNDDKVITCYLKKCWQYYRQGSDKFSYEELLFRSWNIFRILLDTISYRRMILKIHSQLTKSEKGKETLSKMFIKDSNNIPMEIANKYGLNIKSFDIKGPITREWNPAIIYSDGSFNSENQLYGLGYILIQQSKITKVMGQGKIFKEQRNVAGELIAVLSALELSIENDTNIILICYDYEGIEKWAESKWKTNLPLTIRYKNKIKSLRKQGIKIRFKKIKAHSGNHGNEQADKLAKLGCKDVWKNTKETTYATIRLNTEQTNSWATKELEDFQEEIKSLKNKQEEELNQDRDTMKIFWQNKDPIVQQDIRDMLMTGIQQIDQHIKDFCFNINNRYVQVGINPRIWRDMWDSQVYFLNKTWKDFLAHVLNKWIKRKIDEEEFQEDIMETYKWQLEKFAIQYKFPAKFAWLSQLAFLHADMFNKTHRITWFMICKDIINKFNNLFFKKNYLSLMNFNLLNEINEWRKNKKKKPFLVMKEPDNKDILELIASLNTMEEFISEQIAVTVLVDSQGNTQEQEENDTIQQELEESNNQKEYENKEEQEISERQYDIDNQTHFNAGKTIKVKKLQKIKKIKTKTYRWTYAGETIDGKEKANKLTLLKHDMKAMLFAIDLLWNKTDDITLTNPIHALWIAVFNATADYDRIREIYNIIEGEQFDPPCENWADEDENEYISWKEDSEEQEEIQTWLSYIN